MADPIRTILLRRDHLLFLDTAGTSAEASTSAKSSGEGRGFDSVSPSDAFAVAMESRLLDLGFGLHKDLARALRALPADALRFLSENVTGILEAQLGAHRPHIPLFRSFPKDIPQNTSMLFVRRAVAWIFQEPEQFCPFCGNVNTVSALKPCGHWICPACWDGSNYSACPICHFQVERDHPFFLPPTEREAQEDGAELGSKGQRVKLLHLGKDLDGAAMSLFERLVKRSTPLSPTDREDLLVLTYHLKARALSLLPHPIAVKEVMATVLGTVLLGEKQPELCLESVRSHLKTATDVLRVLAVYSGFRGDLMKDAESSPRPDTPLAAALAERMKMPPKQGSEAKARPKKVWRAPIKRPLRRLFLRILEELPPLLMMEDMRRHPALWKWAGERLHPFEFAERFPTAALAFALVRDTEIGEESKLGRLLLETARKYPEHVRIRGNKLRFLSFAGDVETSLARGDVEHALDRLSERPGELLRRSDHVLRLEGKRKGLAGRNVDKYLSSLGKACEKGAAPILLTLLAHLPSRSKPIDARVFFPRGNVSNPHVEPNARPLLEQESIDASVNVVLKELLARASLRSRFDRALLDARLCDLIIPFNERTTSKALVALPRGSELTLPDRFRLFTHWMDSPQYAVDLDLSLALFDHNWKYLDVCDYTHLYVNAGGATHSGDLRSAPAPDGASEFIDVNLNLLIDMGVFYAVMVVFSYTGISFDNLPEAFAGMMHHHGNAGPIFDARKVAQRFDLQGEAKVCVPMVVDVFEQKALWADIKVPPKHGLHCASEYYRILSKMSQSLTQYFKAKSRPTLFQLACVHAAARAREIWVKEIDGSVKVYAKRPDEPLDMFWRRLSARVEADETRDVWVSGDAPVIFAGLDDDVALHEGSMAYALRWAQHSAEKIKRLSPSDWVAELSPMPA